MVTIGIDIGGSRTKIVGFKDGKLIKPISVKATDPITSVYGALGRFTLENGLELDDIDNIAVTGVGSQALKDELYGRPCVHVNEFESVAKGGIYLSGLDKAIVASLGTGTALVYSEKVGKFEYLGGTGVGGGTLCGLSHLILGMSDITHITELAGNGDLNNIDLRVSDLSNKNKSFDLPMELTASNFGKVSDIAEKQDIALGILNMIFETIGMMCVFASRRYGDSDVVLTGYLSEVPQAEEIFGTLSKLMNVNFIIPELSQYATVIGAALILES